MVNKYYPKINSYSVVFYNYLPGRDSFHYLVKDRIVSVLKISEHIPLLLYIVENMSFRHVLFILLKQVKNITGYL